MAAIEAMTRLPDPRVWEILMSLVTVPALRATVLRALAEREDPQSIPLMVQQLAGENDPATLAIIADALGRIGDLGAVEPLMEAMKRINSRTTQREILNAVGSILGGRDAFYPYLAMDAGGRDETVSKILLNMQRRFRQQARGRGSRMLRLAVRARQAMTAYAGGDEVECLHRLALLAQLAGATLSLQNRHLNQAIVHVLTTLDHKSSSPTQSEEALLAVFLTRLLMDHQSD